MERLSTRGTQHMVRAPEEGHTMGTRDGNVKRGVLDRDILLVDDPYTNKQTNLSITGSRWTKKNLLRP